jgi:hypothetical protein
VIGVEAIVRDATRFEAADRSVIMARTANAKAPIGADFRVVVLFEVF